MDKEVLLGVGDWAIDTEQKLGGGSYGQVFLAYKQNDQNQKYAAKRIPLSNNQKDIEKINTELRVFSKANSPYIVKMHDFKKTKNSVYIFMDLCSEGSLSSYIRNGGKLSVKSALDFFQKMVIGYQTIRQINVIHRDIKPDNILIHEGKPKLTDFGLCKIYEDIEIMESNSTKTLVGSEYYMAPELLKYVIIAVRNGKLTERPHYTDKCDVWSMGVVFYYMMEGKRPWDYEKNCEGYLNNITKCPIILEPHWPLEAAHMLTRMLTIDETKRITWDEVFQHPLINPMNVQNVNKQALQQLMVKQIEQYFSYFPPQYKQEIPNLNFAFTGNFNQGPNHQVTSQQPPQKQKDSVQMSIEMEEDI